MSTSFCKLGTKLSTLEQISAGTSERLGENKIGGIMCIVAAFSQVTQRRLQFLLSTIKRSKWQLSPSHFFWHPASPLSFINIATGFSKGLLLQRRWEKRRRLSSVLGRCEGITPSLVFLFKLFVRCLTSSLASPIRISSLLLKRKHLNTLTHWLLRSL